MAHHHRGEARRNHRHDGVLLHAVNSAEKRVENWARKLEDASFEMQQQTKDKKQKLKQYVKTKPFASLGFAALGGAFLALLFKR